MHPPGIHSSRKCRLQGGFTGSFTVSDQQQTAFIWVGCDLAILGKVGCNLRKMPDLPAFVGCSYFHKQPMPPRGYYTHMVEGGTCHGGRSSELPN